MEGCLWLPSIPWCECWFQSSLQFKTEREGMSGGGGGACRGGFLYRPRSSKVLDYKEGATGNSIPNTQVCIRHPTPLVCFVLKMQSLYWASCSFLYLLFFLLSLFNDPLAFKTIDWKLFPSSGQFTTESIYSCVHSSMTHLHPGTSRKRPKTWSVCFRNFH